jgi:hypothetical protein
LSAGFFAAIPERRNCAGGERVTGYVSFLKKWRGKGGSECGFSPPLPQPSNCETPSSVGWKGLPEVSLVAGAVILPLAYLDHLLCFPSIGRGVEELFLCVKSITVVTLDGSCLILCWYRRGFRVHLSLEV